MSICDNLRLITSSSKTDTHKDLIIYIFRQLTTCSIEPFKQAVQRWHIDYLEAKLPDLTPTTLLDQADTKVQILQHAGQRTKSQNPEVMALKLELQEQRTQSALLVQQLAAHVSRIVNHKGHGKDTGSFKHTRNGQRVGGSYPGWMIVPPSYPTETKIQDNRLYTWCTKCRQGQGLWVCRHNTETHVDGFQPERDNKRRGDGNNRQQSHSVTQANTPMVSQSSLPTPSFHGQLSFLDYLNSYLPEDTPEVSEVSPDQDHE
jgi:hypothetical protein